MSVGNQLDVSVVDYAQQVLEDTDVKVVLVYLEGFKPGDGLALAKTALQARELGKALVVYKGGRTPAGSGAAKGHTASLAGDFAVARSVLSAAGALVAETFDDFDDLSAMALLASQQPIRGGRVYFISNAGFEAVGMADSVSPKGPLKADLPGPEVDVVLLSPVPLTPAMQTLPAGAGHPEDFQGKASLVNRI